MLKLSAIHPMWLIRIASPRLPLAAAPLLRSSRHLILLLATGALSAQPKFVQLTPALGTVIVNTSPGYHGGVPSLTVAGSIGGIPKNHAADYRVACQGVYSTLVPSAAVAGQYSFAADVAMGEGKPYWAGSYPAWHPYTQFYANRNAIEIPVVCDLVDVVNAPHVAVVRERTMYIDGRFDQAITVPKVMPPAANAIGSQLTDYGLTKLNPTHQKSLPGPDPLAFNTAFSAELVSKPTLTGTLGSDACVSLDLAPDFKTTKAWTSAQLKATASYTEYGVCVAANLPTCSTVFPVQTPLVTNASSYSVCATSISGKFTDGTMASVTSAELTFSAADTLDAKTTTGRVEATVKGTLKDWRIVWTNFPGTYVRNGPFSIPPPGQNVTQAADIAKVAAFSTCGALKVASFATGNVDPVSGLSFIETHGVSKSAVSPEAFDVNQAAPAKFFWALPAEQLASSGTCGLPTFTTPVATYLGNFVTPAQDSFTAAWDRPTVPQQAQRLDELLQPFETGSYAPLVTDSKWKISQVNVKEGGLSVVQDGNSSLRPAYQALNAPLPYAFSAGNGQPYFDPHMLTPNNLPPTSVPFDIAYSVSTSAMNQILNALSWSTKLNYDLIPTWAELGLNPAKYGLTLNDPVPLTGTVLKDWDPAFLPLGAAKMKFTLSPVFPAFTYIPPDPQAQRQPWSPLTLNLGQYELLVTEDVKGKHDPVVFRGVLDMFDDDLTFGFSLTGTPPVLGALPGAAVITTFTATESALSGCPLMAFVIGRPAASCEQDLSAKLLPLIWGRISPPLIAALGDIAAPSYFNSANHSSVAMKTKYLVRKHNNEQMMTLFGTFQP